VVPWRHLLLPPSTGATPLLLNTGGSPGFSLAFSPPFRAALVCSSLSCAALSCVFLRTCVLFLRKTSSGDELSEEILGTVVPEAGVLVCRSARNPKRPRPPTGLVRSSATLTSPEVAWRTACARWRETCHWQGKRKAQDEP
jgi:hypothetical protein